MNRLLGYIVRFRRSISSAVRFMVREPLKCVGMIGICVTCMAALLALAILCLSKGDYDTFRLCRAVMEMSTRQRLELDERLWKTPSSEFFKDKRLNRLCAAISQYRAHEIAQFIQPDSNINEVGSNGMTVLLFAYMEGDFKTYCELLDRGASPDVPVTDTLETRPFSLPVSPGDTVLTLASVDPYLRFRYLEPAFNKTPTPAQLNKKGESILEVIARRKPPEVEK